MDTTEYQKEPTHSQMQLCKYCPVLEECRDYVLKNDTGNEWDSVWGGMTPYQRRMYRESIDVVLCPSCDSDVVYREACVEQCLSCGISWSV